MRTVAGIETTASKEVPVLTTELKVDRERNRCDRGVGRGRLRDRCKKGGRCGSLSGRCDLSA